MQDGKISKDGFMEFAGVIVGADASKLKIAEDLANECGMIKEDDRCELAGKASICLKTGGMKRNIDFGF